MTVREKKEKKKAVEFPSLGSFSQFYKGRSKFAETLTNTIADVYEWSTNLQPSSDNLPLPFVSKNDEVIWSYLKHQNRQLELFNRRYKDVLGELSGKEFIEVKPKRQLRSEEEEEEEIEDEEEDLDDEEEIEDEDLEDFEDEEEGDVDLFNLKEADLKTLDADLKAMENESDSNGEEENGIEKPEEPKKYRKSIVDDAFFSLEEMNNFLEKTERANPGTGEQNEMMFEDEDDWDGKTTYTYEDFFGARDEVEETPVGQKKKRKAVEEVASEKKRVRFAMDEEEEDEEEPEEENENEEIEGPVLLGGDLEEDKEETEYSKRQKKMRQQIAKLEEENLKPRNWELSGEVAADQREKNTLLEQHVDFDHGAKRAPEVTEEFTDKLEELIKQRIRDKAFDDVVRVKKIENKGAKFETEALENIHNQKTTLAEVYEKEYQEKTDGNASSDGKTVVNEAHEKIKSKMSELFGLIDALTHFEYKPAESREDVKIVTNISALRIEEVGAMASSEGQLMAPEEVAKKMRAAELKGEEEREKTDKLRERRKKKSKQRALVEKLGEDRVFGEQKAAKLAKKNAKENGGTGKAEKLKSSNFFSKLQDTVQQEKSAKKTKKVVKRVKSEKNSAAIKL